MSHDYPLIETIKANFARKSSAQLEEIVRADDLERWSPEAIAAAREVLTDRENGSAEEPAEAEEDVPIPSTHDEKSLAFIAGLNLFALPLGFVVFPVNRRRVEDAVANDLPVPFGAKMAWLALQTTDTEAVAAALDLQETIASTWADGINAANGGSVFVTPPVADWNKLSRLRFIVPQ